MGESVIANCQLTVTDYHLVTVSRLLASLSLPVSRLSLTLYQTLGTGIPDASIDAVQKTPGTLVPGILHVASKLLW